MNTKITFLILFLFAASNTNAQWQQMNTPPGGIACLAISDSVLFAGNGYLASGLYLSTDRGNSWTLANGWDPYFSTLSIAVNGSSIYAGYYDNFGGGGSGGGIRVSNDNGNSWSPVTMFGSNFNGVEILAAQGSTICAGLGNAGVMLSNNNGTTWQPMPALPTPAISLALLGRKVFAGSVSGTFVSDTSRIQWSPTTFAEGAISFAVNGASIFAGKFDFMISNAGHGLSVSSDSGNTWQSAGNGLTNATESSIVFSGTDVFAGTGNWSPGSGVFLSHDTGSSWTPINAGLTNLNILSLAVSSTDLYAIALTNTSNNLFRRPLSDFITGVKEPGQDVPGFVLYPNPLTSSSTLAFNTKLNDAEVTIFDILGNVMLQKTITGNSIHLDNGKLARGVYFVNVKDHERNYGQKLIVQ